MVPPIILTYLFVTNFLNEFNIVLVADLFTTYHVDFAAILANFPAPANTKLVAIPITF
jgi:hypothetical protein